MDKNKIKKEYNQKIQNLVKLNKNYYDLSKPLVNDYEYDQIKAEILSLEKQYNFLKSENSPSKVVGFKPSKTFKKVIKSAPDDVLAWRQLARCVLHPRLLLRHLLQMIYLEYRLC